MSTARCSLPRCKAAAVTQLFALDGPFLFCDAHAAKYEALGYRREPLASDGQTQQLQIEMPLRHERAAMR